MKLILLFTILLAVLYCCTIADAQELNVPHWLTCDKVNYTYIDYNSQGPWISLGKYWMDTDMGDNKSFFTAQNPNAPYVLLRVNNGLPPGSNSMDALIRPWDRECITSNGYSLANIYSYFQVNGTYQGQLTVNDVLCNEWYAEFGANPPSRYWLYVSADPINGIHVPIRHVAIETTGISVFPIQTTVMDFLSTCKPTVPPPFTFTTPSYCPPVYVPVSFPPKPKIFPPPGMLKAKQMLENILNL